MRLLFITSTRIGDAILGSGVLDDAIRRHPGIRVTVACGPAPAPLFAAVPGLERIIPLRKRPAGLHWAGLWAACAGYRWREVIDLRRSALGWMLLAGRRRIPAAVAGPVHKVEQLARGLGMDRPPEPVLWTSPADRAAAAALLDGAGPVLALAPAANWPGKQWPADRFAELIGRLTGAGGALPGARLAIMGGPEERQAILPAIAALPGDRLLDLVGRASLPVLGAVLRDCALFVGNDSGLMHLAAAAGTPTLGLFGPSRDQVYGPRGVRTAVIRTPESYEELVGRPGYDHRTTGTLMGGLTVAAVHDAARDLLARCGTRAA